MEQLLTAAGFQAVPANTDARHQELVALPAGRLIAQPHGNGFTYVLADPRGCDCLYIGDADYRLSAMNWNLWGPYRDWNWSGPIFIHGGSHWDHDRGDPGPSHGGRSHRRSQSRKGPDLWSGPCWCSG
jgi:hypothetical protein